MSSRYDDDEDVDASSVWVGSLPAWHASFALLVTLSAAMMFVVAPVDKALGCAGLLVVLGLGYAVFGVRAARDRDARSRWLYLGPAAVVCLFATWLIPSAAVLLFILFPQSWLLAERARDGVLASLALTVAVAAGPALGGARAPAYWRGAAPSLVVGLVFSIVLGIFILRLIDQSRERAVLLHELTLAQDELAGAHHAAGVVAERQRLAAEIHDTLAQGFTSIAMQAEAGLAGSGVGAEADRLHLIARTARDNLAEARALVAAFSPAPLKDTSLADAVRRVAERFQDETGVTVAVRVEGGVDGLPRDHEVVVLRAVQEALANVRKHAGARRVDVSLVVAEGALSAEIRDDGVGFARASGSGFGIAAMTSRVREVGGEVDLASTPGQGTRLRIAIPRDEPVHER